MTVDRTDRAPMPGRIWYWVAGAFGITGVVIFVVFLFTGISGMGDGLDQMLAPGEAEFSFAEPGDYTVFHEHESVFEGRYYSSPTVVSGLAVEVLSKAGGSAVEVRPASANASYALEGRESNAVFEFEIVAPGPYRVTAAYADGRGSLQVVLAIGHGFMSKLMTTIFGGLAIMFVGLGGAGVIAVFTYLKRERAITASKKG